jgi:hypothetical protein
MKKFILMMLIMVGGVLQVHAWGDLYLICGENSSWSNTSYTDAFKFTCLAENSYRATVPGSYITSGAWYFRFRDKSSDTWQNISPESTEDNQEITGTAYSTNWQNSDKKAFYISQNTNAKYVHIYAQWNTSTNKWDLTSEVITSTTSYDIAYTNPSGWADDNVKVYAFLDGVTLAGSWPGTVMTKSGDIYTATITGAAGTKIIFSNNGSNQSWTLDLADEGIYNSTSKVEKVNISAGANGKSTFSSTYPLNFASATNISAYTISSLSKTAATLSKVTGTAPAKTGLLITGATNANEDIPTIISTTSVGTNYLQAAVTETAVTAGQAYVLKSGEFHPADAGTIPAGKAYLLADDIPKGARSLSLVFDDEAASIEGISERSVKSFDFFNLAGQRITTPSKGLYIVNGKKVIVK